MGNNRILFLNEKGEFIRSFGQHVSRPNGLISDNTGRIFVTNRGNDRILVFNQNGEYVSTLNKPGSIIGPRGISLDSQGNIIVCDAEDHCVKIFSPHGNILKTIGRGWLSQDRPMGCLCYEGKIFVSDSETHVIKVYNSKGKFLYEFGTHATKDGNLNQPVCLAVDKTGHLLVCCAGSHEVQVFTLDGEFVTKFGEHGSMMDWMGTDPSLTHDTCKSSDYFVGYLQLQSFLLPLHLPFLPSLPHYTVTVCTYVVFILFAR